MGANTRTPARRAADRKEIVRLYLTEGLNQHEVAARVGISQEQVSYDLRAVAREWQRQAVADVDAARGAELAKLAQLEAEYWDAWRTQTDKDESRRPAYLDGVLKCIERRCKLLGIDAPQKLDVTSKGQQVSGLVTAVNYREAIAPLAPDDAA